MTLSSPAKINLYLRVFERRTDGYHRVETAMIKLALADTVSLELKDGKGFEISVPGHPDLETETNLAVRAARLYFENSKLEKKIVMNIDKKIPIAGGLGGGSSNAAAVLLALNERLHKFDQMQLLRLGSKLGADVPFFIQTSNLGVGRGIGDQIETWPTPPARPLVLVNPGHPVPTAEVYKALERPLTWKASNDNSSPPLGEPKNWYDLERLLGFGNDLEAPAQRLYPAISTFRERLVEEGATFARMSGSGGTVFGFFNTKEEAKRAADRLSGEWKTWVTETAT